MRSSDTRVGVRERRRHGIAADVLGNIAIILALALPVLLLAVGGALDYANVIQWKARLQGGADASAIAGAKELSLADSNKVDVSSIVAAVAASYLKANIQGPASAGVTTATQVTDASGAPLQVEVTVSTTVKSNFGASFGLGDIAIQAKSVAIVVGKPNICLLALDPSAMGTLYLQKNAKVVGQNCSVYSNSTHPNGIKAFNSSMLTATTICSAGGHAGGKGNFQPSPLNDCPQFDDPLSSRPEPAAGPCVANNLVVDSMSVRLKEGTYCGGIRLRGAAQVTLDPGLFIMKDGPLLVQDSSKISGVNVGVFFVGGGSRFSFATGSTIDLTAPKGGAMAGMLFFASRSQSGVRHEIFSDNARELLGTIYLPTGELSIDANQPIADKSAYTAIVALKVTANSGPTVTLNTNYDQTDIPVPDGIRGAGQPVRLLR